MDFDEEEGDGKADSIKRGRDDGDQDSDYEGICKPPILRQLKNILDQYPDGSQIIRELVQNAEDAGARSFKIHFAKGNRSSSAGASTSRYTKYFRAPALCVYNDGVFSAEDWTGIKSIYTSIKEKDALKVGRFGLGFKSIFHITDSPIIISGDKLLIIDPHELPHRVCHRIPFRKLKTEKYREAWPLMRETLGLEGNGLFELNESVIERQYYPRTLFWFPLRQEVSELSSKIYTTEKMTELFESFEKEAETILLFLKSVRQISIYDTQLREIFEVQMKGKGNTDITEDREYIKNQLTRCNIAAKSLWSEFKAVLRIQRPQTQQNLDQEWYIVNLFQGENDMSENMAKVAHDEQLSYAPYVGVAFPLTQRHHVNFNGHVFCFLPLPIEPDGKSLTNLPVHVNGFFALTSNRRHMLWATQDQHESDDNRLVWNKLMISEVLSSAYTRLVDSLLEDSDISPEILYQCLPDAENVDSKWSILLKPLFTKILKLKMFWTGDIETPNRTKVCFEESLFFIFDSKEKVFPTTAETLWRMLTVYTEKLVRLPNHLKFAVCCDEFISKGSKACTINADLICNLLKENPRYKTFERSQKLDILHYLLENTTVDQLENLELLPTDEPTSFVSFRNSNETVYICSNGEEKIFPLMEKRLLSSIPEDMKGHLLEVAKSGGSAVRLFSTSDFGHLLQESIDRQQLFEGTRISPSKQSDISKWILEVWRYLAAHDDLIEGVEHLSILPEVSVNNNSSVIQLQRLRGIYIVERQGSSVLPETVREVLHTLGVTILQAYPGYLPSTAIQRYIFSPTVGSVCEILAKVLTRMTSLQCLVEKFEDLPESRRKEFAVFMSQAREFEPIVARFLKSIKMFPSTRDKNTECICSLSEVQKLAPLNHNEYPIGYPYPLIPGDFKGAPLILELGFHRQTDEDLTMDILCAIKNGDYSVQDVDAFMTYFLTKMHMNNATPEHIEKASSIPFVLSTDEKRRPPKELFEPTEEAFELFCGETDRFPKDLAYAKLHVNGLHTLGLKSAKDILIRDIMQTLDFLTTEGLDSLNQTKIKIGALEKYVNSHDLSSREGQQLLEKMKHSRWMLKMTTKPKHYPEMMTWYSANNNLDLEIPNDLYHSDYSMLVGSVAMVAESNLRSDILDLLLHKRPSIDVVLNQLLLLTGKYETVANPSEFWQMLQEIYHSIAKETDSGFEFDLCKEKKLVWTGKVFVKPRQVFVNFLNEATEIALEPFMYKLPEVYAENGMLKSLFLKLGCKAEIEVKDLISILNCIKDRQMSSSLVESKHNLNVVIGILNVLEEMKQFDRLSEENMNDIHFPVQSHSNNFQLLPAAECTYVDYKRDTDEEEEDEDLKYVHPKIRSSVAAILGVPSLTRRIVESKGVEDIPWGQKEELTDRLKNLIEDYADGTSVLKEMLQNADDAGASCLRILYDERTNENALTGLIDKGMAECQGPAIWVYNDAKFDEKDFQNIIKLGAGTKETDLTKIGKFGLGFCSVYNITDMPSILSGESLVILDPRTIHLGKALKDNNPGLRFRISDSKTRHRLRHQLRPFNGIFTCDFQNEDDWMSYEGTLFRLPLRTAKDADETKHQISPKHYTRKDVILLIKKFIQDAGNLMLFIQSVNAIEFYHCPQEATEAYRFYKIQRNSKLPKENMLKKANEALLTQTTELMQVREDITITVDILNKKLVEKIFQNDELKANSSESEWTISWQLGSKNQYPFRDSLKRHVVLGSTAIPIKHCLLTDWTEKKSTDIPLGFYRTGHIFCFLPLPQESFLPVHVNGYFAVESSRRRLTISHSDNVYSDGAEWNKFILRNPVCLSFLNVLENLSVTISKENYYEKWPLLGKDEMINELVISFYEHLILSEHKLFHGDGLSGDAKMYHFKECIFLDPSMRYDLGQNMGEKIFNCYLKFNANGPSKHAMDLPEYIYKQLQEIPACNCRLKENICNEKAFYLFSFIPSLSTDWWCNAQEERNTLLLHVLQYEDEEVRQKLQETPCIPTKPFGKLRKPQELIFPDSYSSGFCVSRLFDIEDERFPSEEFMKSNIVRILMEFGMMTEKLSNELVIDRAKSVQRLSSKPKVMKERCNNVLKYLKLKMEFHKQIQKSIQDIKFLPVLQKPETSEWPFKWYSAESKKLESGKKLFFLKCRNIVGCVKPVVDLGAKFDVVLEYLGLRGISEVEEKTVIDQLEEITSNVSDVMSDKVWSVLEDVYAYLDKKDCRMINSFKDKRCLLTKSAGLVKPEICATELQTDIQPFLFKVEDRWKKYQNFLRSIGVKKTFSTHYLVQTIGVMDTKEGEHSHYVPSIVRLLNMLSESTRRYEFQSQYDLKTMLLPDENGVMRKATDLCIDDNKCRITKDNKILFVHGGLNTWTTSLFEIKSKSAQFIKRFAGAISFGQSEKLVTRLKGILRDYPCNVSILNELLQNADDAGATEIHFIHDQRTHPKESLFDKSLEQTQGPSLVVFNNSCFSKKDIEGISNLGEGSKGSDPMTTGQFGIGFNAVYHMTDVPSFLTIGENVPNGGALVMFDPHCKYVPLATPQKPGMMLENIQIIKETYPDMYRAYLTEEVPSSTGTWFRFPLRTDHMAQQSQIKHGRPMTNSDLENLFTLLREDMPKSLMFLSKIEKITLSVIPADGEIQKIALVSAKRIQTDQNKLLKFNNDAKHYINALREGEVNLGEIEPLSVQYQLELNVSCNKSNYQELWCVSQVCGVQASLEVGQRLIDAYKNEEICLSPRSGVAYKIVEKPDIESSQAFNFLPLPVRTNLPVHINGHFAVDSARTNIWQDFGRETLKGFWNNFLLKDVLPFAYAKLVCFLRGYLFKDDSGNILETVNVYNNAFPILSSVSKTKWACLVEGFYQTAWEKKMEIFPIYLPTEVYDTLRDTHHFLTKETKTTEAGECISFVSLNNNDHKFLAYFMPPKATRGHIILPRQPNEEMPVFDAELSSILKLLGMKILTSSTNIANSVQETLKPDKRVPFLTVGDIVMFLKSWNTGAVDKCRITTVGVPIEETLFRDIKPIKKLAFVCFGSTIHKHIDQLEGIPLCVRNDTILEVFSKDKKKLVSQYSDLLPKSWDQFLHGELIHIFEEQLPIASEFLSPLGLETFSKLLGKNMSERLFADIPVPLSEKHQDRNWFCRFWEYLSSLSGKDVVRDCEKYLGSWCLIPAASKSSKRIVLFPFKLRYAVLETESFSSQNHQTLSDDPLIGKILTKLDLPSPCKTYIGDFRDSFVLKRCVQRVCASSITPENVLSCLIHHKGQIALSPKDAESLVKYLFRKLHDSFSRLKEKFREVILYESIDGVLTSFKAEKEIVCMDHGCIPTEGLQLLCKYRSLKILKRNYLLQELYNAFSVKEMNAVIFYRDYFLSNPQLFDPETRMIHMEYIKQTKLFDSSMQHLIRKFPFVQNTETRQLQRVCEFLTPFSCLCRQMCNKSELLPLDPFYKEDWKEFLVYAGLKTQIPIDVLLRFATKIDERQCHETDESLLSHSKLLLAEIMNVPDLYKEQHFLRELRQIKCLIPDKVGKEYAQIVGHFTTGQKLISFENAVYHEGKLMIWSSCKILPDLKHLNIPTSQWKKVEELLLIQKTPPLKDVISHFHKLCHALEKMVKNEAQNRKLQNIMGGLQFFMERLYSDLEVLAPNKSDIAKLRKGFCETPLIYNKEHNRFLRLDQVALELKRNEEIPPYLCRGSETFGKHYSFFRKLGVADEACIHHYVRVFDLLHTSVGNRSLFPEELTVCQKTMTGFLLSLEKSSKSSLSEEEKYANLLEFPCVYLPTDEDRSVKLVKSSDLTLRDTSQFEQRMGNFSLIKFVKYVRNDILQDNRLLSCLPGDFQPMLLSQQVKEVIHSVDACECSELVETLNRKFQKADFVNGICAILSKSADFAGAIRERCQEKLRRLRFQQVSNLKTKLHYLKENMEISGSLESQTIFYESAETVVYMNVQQNLRSKWRYIKDPLFEILVKISNGIAIQHRQIILKLIESESSEEMKEVLSTLDVTIQTNWEPNLGSYVPADLHDYLDNSFREFHPGEIVAYEVLNPLVDAVTDYVFIYVRIIKKRDNCMFPMYDINDGSETHSEIAFRLYRFVHSDESNTSTEVERYTDLQGEVYQSKKGVIFEEIKWTLIEAWKYQPSDFQRVRIRLLMNWHPDKHPNNPLATEVTQYINEIVRRLKNDEFKEFLESCSDDSRERRSYYYRNRKRRGFGERQSAHAHPQSAHTQPQSTDYDDWLHGCVNRRRRQRRHNWTSWGSGQCSGQETIPNPQPEVGKLWLKQAKYDMNTAIQLKRSVSSQASVNEEDLHTLKWVCYMCQKVIEKCIRSLMYRDDSNKAEEYRKTSHLVSLSYCVSVPELTPLCQQFLSQVCDDPERIIYPSFSGVFNSNHVDTGCSIAQEVVGLCDEQLN